MEQGEPMVSLPSTEPYQLSSSSRMGCDQMPGKEQVGHGGIWLGGKQLLGLEFGACCDFIADKQKKSHCTVN